MVAANPTPLHAVGDEESSKRRQILDGARKVFMDLGFDGASMGEIARSAGVSKGTLYVYFADKNRLFEAIVEEEMLDQAEGGFQFRSRTRRRHHASAVRPGLYRVAVPAGRRLGDPHRDGDRRADAGGRPPLLRACAGENHQSPRRLSRGACEDQAISPSTTASWRRSQFMQMCQASLFLPFIFQAAPAPSTERIVEVVESATRMFLAAYRRKTA